MNKQFDPPKRDRWARLRFSVIGPLMTSPPEPGRLRDALLVLAAKTWRHPDTGLDVHFGVSTLERWYYASRRSDDPLVALRDRLRGDEGRFPSMSEQAVAALTAQYREHSGWTAQLHLDNLRVTLQAAGSAVASYATVRRFLLAQGMHRKARPKRATEGAVLARDRLEQLEVRSFEVEHVGALLHLDFHHGSRKVLTRGGLWATPMLVGFIDDRSRLVCHLQWYLDETAQSLVHGLSQAFMKRGLPRAVMTDNGAAMVSEEFVCGLARLGVVHQTTLPYSPYQNAKQESFWSRIEGRLMPMLEGEQTLTLDRLNEASQAWVEQEYHRTVHSEIGVTPLQVARFLEASGANRIITIDIHAEAIEGFLWRAHLENLHAHRVITSYFRQNLAVSDMIVVAPDVGSADRGRTYASSLGTGLAIVDKERNYEQPSTIKKMSLVGDVRGKNVFMGDDLVATGGTLLNAARLCKEKGAEKIFFACTLPFLSGKAHEKFDKAREEGLFVGISSGASLAAVAAKLPELASGARVLTFCYDTGERYLSVEGLF